jgi:RNA polymerase primary sigma factor
MDAHAPSFENALAPASTRPPAGRKSSRRLTVEDELRLTRVLDAAETEMARAVVRSPRALAALGRIGHAVSAGTIRTRDVLRRADPTAASARASRVEVIAVLEEAGRLGEEPAARECAPLAQKIAALHLQSGVFDRLADTIEEGEARRAFDQARRSSRRAKAEWTAACSYLVVAIARRYRRPGVDTVDLVQDGNIGLLRAVEKFDPSLGHRFHVYAAWWIRQHVFRALASSGRTIRVPLPMVEASHRIARARRVFEGVHGEGPDDGELAALSGIDVATVAAVSAIIDEPVSLFGRAGDDEPSVLDRLSDRTVDLPDEQVERARVSDRVRTLFEELPSREREVLRMRFGLDGGSERTHGEVAAALGVSRERARRMEEHALTKLRAWSMRGRVPHVAA